MTFHRMRCDRSWALSLLLAVTPSTVFAQGTALPAITVDKPKAPAHPPPKPNVTRRPQVAKATAPAHPRPHPVRAAAAKPAAARLAEAAALPATPSPGGSATGIGAGTPPVSQRFQLPQDSASISAQGIEQTVNAVDSEDAIKYFPSLFVRKRNNGDTQPVLATRTNGVNASARTIVYADDVNISALLANNNTIGAPRWGLVAPEEISRVDFLYGPFAAAYPGNSVGGVLLIQTKMPEKLEVNIKQNEGFQTFNQYSTNKTFRTDQTSASIGDKVENLSWFLSGSHLNSFSQPLAYVTNGTIPAGTSGAFFAQNKTGAIADVVGAAGLQHQEIDNVKLKVAYDFTSWLQATYTFGFYSNFTSSNVQSYLTTATGMPTFGGVAGFASNQYTLDEKHIANSIKVATNTRGPFDWEAVVSNYDFLNDVQRSPFGVTPTGTGFTTNGKSAVLNGTNWTNADLKGIWRPFGINGSHEVSFGLHGDQYNLHNPTYAVATWYGGSDIGGPLYSNGRGVTETGALWAQDAWRLRSDLKFTVGARAESWRARDGLNVGATTTAAGAITATTTTVQPSEKAMRVSPKATLAWDPDPAWSVKASFGEANRFPTVSELYQIVQTGTTYQTPNPNLRPEQAFSEELAVERHWTDGSVRVSLFQENDNSALISQTNFITGATAITSFVNVNETRLRGVELAARQDNVVVHGLELSGSVTYTDSRILSDPNFASTTGTTATGKRVPYIPDWRATLAATYRPDTHWAFTVAGRYSGKQYSTLDNTDVVSGVFGAFDRFLVVDTRINYAFNDKASIGFGVDNIGNEKYFLFHPFPQRTFYADARLKF
jgi:iron complex outermembrane receptor protein